VHRHLLPSAHSLYRPGVGRLGERRAEGPGADDGTGGSAYDASPEGRFPAGVDEARRRLIRDEGQNVSVRELIRRAGFDDSRRTSVARHLNPNQP
jgi:hypothetical protein